MLKHWNLWCNNKKGNKGNSGMVSERAEHDWEEQTGHYERLVWETKPQIPDLIRMGSPLQAWTRVLLLPLYSSYYLNYTLFMAEWYTWLSTYSFITCPKWTEKWICHQLHSSRALSLPRAPPICKTEQKTNARRYSWSRFQRAKAQGSHIAQAGHNINKGHVERQHSSKDGDGVIGLSHLFVRHICASLNL